MSTRVQSDNSQAGSLTAGTNSSITPIGLVQYLFQTATATSWTFQWAPPATNVGNVVVYVAGVGSTFGDVFTNSYILTPGSVPMPDSLALSPASLTFNYAGTAPPTQAVRVTSSGAPLAVTTSVSTASGGSWLTATPPGGNTPLPVTVSVNQSGLMTGMYTGTVTITSAGATNSPQTVPVTFNVTAPPPPTLPTLVLGSTALTFNAATGGTAMPQSVAVSSSSATAIVFNPAAATTTGGAWLSVTQTTGTTPANESVSVNLMGLAAGIYHGTVTFTSTGASNSPVALGVTLNVTNPTPPPPPPSTAVTFSFNVRDKQSGGTDSMLLDGSGSLQPGSQLSGSGHFTRYHASPSMDDAEGGTSIVASGTWTATSLTSFTPAAGTRGGGILVLGVKISIQGGTTSTGSLRIASTGTESGVTLAIDGGATFSPTGTGRVTIRSGSTTGGTGDDSTDSVSERN